LFDKSVAAWIDRKNERLERPRLETERFPLGGERVVAVVEKKGRTPGTHQLSDRPTQTLKKGGHIRGRLEMSRHFQEHVHPQAMRVLQAPTGAG